MIISASRRTDIPRFHFDWFMERVDEGFTGVSNPFNAAQKKRVSLKPLDVDCFVFWTRDPKRLLDAPDLFETYPFYVMTTLTAYPKILEPDMPPKDDVINTMQALAREWGTNRVVWRYDPVMLSNITDFEFHKRNFRELASRLSGITERVIFSIYDEYSGARRRLSVLEKKNDFHIIPHFFEEGAPIKGSTIKAATTKGAPTKGAPTPELMDLVSEFSQIAKSAGIEIQSCAEEYFSDCGIKKGACIDGALIQKIIGRKIAALENGPDKNQRPQCLCMPAVDIGVYSTCPAGCVYCYARR